MNNYPPILAPAMKLIEELQAKVAAQQARIDELCAMVGIEPDGADTVAIDRDEPEDDTKPVRKDETEKVAEPVSTATAELYTDQPIIVDDGTAAFEAEYVNEIPNCYKLTLNGARGTFVLNDAPDFYDMLAYGLADKIIPVADYSVEQVPNGNGGFNMADLDSCKIVNVEPGELLLDGPYWKVTKKAKVEFKTK